MKDWYDILGVPNSADPALIKATYRSLVRIYHPDVFLGDEQFAERKLKELNEAFEVLSDTAKRAKYDEEFGQSKGFDHGSDFSSEDFSDEFNTFHNIIEERWQVALEYLPHLEDLFKQLAKIDRKLAFVFQAFLLETQEFTEAEKFSEILLNEYLEKKFGKDKRVHNLVLSAIDSGNRKFASDLNKALSVVGEGALQSVLDRLAEKHEDFASIYYQIHGIRKSKGSIEERGFKPGVYSSASGVKIRILPDHGVTVIAWPKNRNKSGHDYELYPNFAAFWANYEPMVKKKSNLYQVE